MQSLTIIQLQKMLIRFCDHIITHKQKINSINVFPVPDQDTGSNLATTFEEVKKGLLRQEFSSVKPLAECVEKTALYAAQGNSGIIFTGFITGLLESLCSAKTLDVEHLYLAFRLGAKKARLSIEHPEKGTVLDVIDAVVGKMERLLDRDNLSVEMFLKESFLVSKKALNRTTEDLPVLRDSKVVDAGGLAFVMLVESFYESLTGKKLLIEVETDETVVTQSSSSITANRFEVVFILVESLISQKDIQEMLSPIGDSIDIIEVSNTIKAHIHTDKPQIVKEIANSLGNVVYLQIVDMKEEKVLEKLDTKGEI